VLIATFHCADERRIAAGDEGGRLRTRKLSQPRGEIRLALDSLLGGPTFRDKA
jgi:hypothetical protein